MAERNPDFNLSLVYNGASDTLKVFDHTGRFRYSIEARNDTTESPKGSKRDFFGYRGRIPPGVYTVGEPQKIPMGEAPYGYWFIPIYGPAAELYERVGLAIHGGGSGAEDPFAPRQGWVVTHGCLRLQNEDMDRLAKSILWAMKHGGRITLRVVQ